eukprot:Lithocolla_globosa_v1_NODE_11251_length_523_cov_1.532051.p1 type:complete len:115 gc:universal NODE_11251_length_523_cov_1.532051:381-37(-)
MFFCPTCGSLLALPSNKTKVACNVCLVVTNCDMFESDVITSKSAPNAYDPFHLPILDLSGGGKQQNVRAMVDQVCPECNAPKMAFHTMQLRSSDEGQTVFFTCVECGHKFSQNS